ncbi:DeoR/GlpR family DNA-binding transcription regulator [Clostridium baratii]|uniref:DeoR/GlpR family DNA-binding transcription regulator n=1 Tax=Clostridium baratii TaxID=1561 RepID=UPI0005F2FDA7|nr:DeoR/GlpR family DNA-binding transcription regulator [Clostridium baratii]AQM60555.1 DeoR family transcriptional regulator [Clostridium baratii]KJU72900.1 DeoR faimly transcriptional regulator [Clostridium baratii]
MLKEERHSVILNLLNEKGIVKVSEITEILNVTEMTVRRDLQDLENKGLLTRIHGGAQLNNLVIKEELSHLEKKNINIKEKKEIAKKIASKIVNGDSVFLGPGTTIELVYEYINADYLKIVTNSIHVFNKFINDSRYELILIGGSYRNRTGAFVGSIANDTLSRMNIKKAFIGVNGIYNDAISNSNEDEGMIQATVLNNSLEKYIVSDSSKLNKRDFYEFYKLEDVTAIITDTNISKENINKYSKYTEVIF